MLNKTRITYQNSKFKFSASVGLSLLACLAIAAMIQLGNWQRHRALEKQAIIDQFQQNRKKEALPLKKILALSKKDLRYQPVVTTGEFLNVPLFLLDNQQQENQIGFYVIQPFKPDNQDLVVLVNRGFIPRPIQRLDKLPYQFTIDETQTIHGQLISPTKTLTLGQNEERQADGYIILQRLETKSLQHYFHYPIYQYLIQLNSSQWSFTLPKAPTEYLTPDRHYGYALQWYTMALTLLIIYFIVNTKKVSSS